tara:strand:- start:50400 stop:50654 length:255 start_codon:yes stop_codon:yes gene_type:complete
VVYRVVKNENKIITCFLMIGALSLFPLVFVLLGIVPKIIALVDTLINEFTENNKIAWLLVVLRVNFFGTVLYFTIVRKHRILSE